MVVGKRKISKKIVPIFWFSLKTKKPEPRIRHIIAPTNNIGETESGMPFDDMNSTFFEKLVTLLGIALININEIATLAIKSRSFLKNFFFKPNFFKDLKVTFVVLN